MTGTLINVIVDLIAARLCGVQCVVRSIRNVMPAAISYNESNFTRNLSFSFQPRLSIADWMDPAFCRFP